MDVKKTKLTFKGDKKEEKKMKKKRKVSSADDNHKMEGANEKEAEEEVGAIKNGSGTIRSSGSTIYGTDTKFMSELRVGDGLLIIHPLTELKEAKIVRIVVSDTGASLSSPFSTSLEEDTPFQYVRSKGSHEAASAAKTKEENAKRKRVKEANDAVGIFASSYVEKKSGSSGGVRIVKVDTKNKERSDLLNIRSSKKSDRYCY